MFNNFNSEIKINSLMNKKFWTQFLLNFIYYVIKYHLMITFVIIYI
jgi:hypothetical protein